MSNLPADGSHPLVPAHQNAIPPHPLDSQWYIHDGRESYGPYSGHQMKDFASEGRITSSTDIVPVGGETWRKAGDDAVIGALLPSARSMSPPPLPSVAGVSAAAGATIVQVTNNLAPQPTLQHVVVESGEAKQKSAGLALVLSILCVGLGQIYNGQVGKGILMFFLCILTWFAMLGWIVMLWSWIDAYRTAKAMNTRYERRLAMGVVV